MFKTIPRRSFGRLALTSLVAGASLSMGGVRVAHALFRDDIGPGVRVPGPPVAANAQDKFVLAIDEYVLVITSKGEVFAHRVAATVEPAYRLDGERVRVSTRDRWVLVLGRGILVISDDGRARRYALETSSDGWSHRPTGVRPAEAVSCPTPIGANPEDRRALVLGPRLLVLRSDGRVGGHRVIGDNRLDRGELLDASGVAANPVDRWVVPFDRHIVVVTDDGRVFAHRIADARVERAFPLYGPRVAANAQDRWLLAQPSRVLVITRDGGVFAHQMFQNVPG